MITVIKVTKWYGTPSNGKMKLMVRPKRPLWVYTTFGELFAGTALPGLYEQHPLHEVWPDDPNFAFLRADGDEWEVVEPEDWPPEVCAAVAIVALGGRNDGL